MLPNLKMNTARSGLVALALLCVSLCGSAVTMADAFKSAAEAPLAWSEYSVRLKAACETALQADEPTARRLNAALENMKAAAQQKEAQTRVKVSLWIGPSGTIVKVDFPPLPSPEASVDLRLLLATISAGSPPPDMLQPVQLMLSLVPRK